MAEFLLPRTERHERHLSHHRRSVACFHPQSSLGYARSPLHYGVRPVRRCNLAVGLGGRTEALPDLPGFRSRLDWAIGPCVDCLQNSLRLSCGVLQDFLEGSVIRSPPP